MPSGETLSAQRGGSTPQPGSKYIMTIFNNYDYYESRLTIQDLLYSDSGNYTCSMRLYSRGQVSGRIELSLQGKCRFTSSGKICDHCKIIQVCIRRLSIIWGMNVYTEDYYIS